MEDSKRDRGSPPDRSLPGLISEALSTWIQARDTESKPPSYPRPTPPRGRALLDPEGS